MRRWILYALATGVLLSTAPTAVYAGSTGRRNTAIAATAVAVGAWSNGTGRKGRRNTALLATGGAAYAWHRYNKKKKDERRVARTARDGVHAIADLPSLLRDADVVVLVVPLTDETRGLVDAGFLAAMKDGALLVNVARGAVVDTEAVVAALHAGRLHYATDVAEEEPLPADHPLWDAPNLLVSPHVGGASSAMWPRARRLVRDQLHRYAAGEELVNVMSGPY